jgi:hypothetical protein
MPNLSRQAPVAEEDRRGQACGGQEDRKYTEEQLA